MLMLRIIEILLGFFDGNGGLDIFSELRMDG